MWPSARVVCGQGDCVLNNLVSSAGVTYYVGPQHPTEWYLVMDRHVPCMNFNPAGKT